MNTLQNHQPFLFLSQVRDELQKVVWPSRETTLRLTITVIVISIVVGTFIGLLDLVFTKMLEITLGG